MSSLESLAQEWTARGWLALLAFSMTVLVVAALRRPCRRWFGAERAFQLWLLPPLAMLASQLPHPASTPMDALPAVVYVIAAAAALPAHAATATAFDWRSAAMLLWLVGSIAALGLAATVQWRYRRRLIGATPMPDVAMRWPVLRASGVDVGPALVGAWRVRIVLPADFDSRYDATERALILAHEATHARRRDGWWCLCAQVVAAVCWFHPLAWWALAALRHDQELACDAAVLRGRRRQRRSYATAMLKTQSAAFPLPVGCPWSPRHPITERIAMLKSNPPSPRNRRIGRTLLTVLAVSAAGLVYAASPATQPASTTAPADRFTLAIEVATHGHPASMHFTRCVRAGEPFDVSGSDDPGFSWDGRFAVTPVAKGQLEVRGKFHMRVAQGGGDTREFSGQPVVRTLPGRKAIIVFGQKVDGDHLAAVKLTDNTVRIDLTPTRGCSRDALATP